MVRLQRGKRRDVRHAGDQRVRRDQHGDRHGGADLDDRQLVAQTAAERPGRRRGCRRRPGGDHSGVGAGVVCYAAIQLRERIRVDDALDVWAVHGIGGTWGALATGLFATVAINTAGANGLFYGNPKQALIQLVAIGASWGWSIIGTFAILKLVNLIVPLRVGEDEEALGLDLSQHGEPAYADVSAF